MYKFYKFDPCDTRIARRRRGAFVADGVKIIFYDFDPCGCNFLSRVSYICTRYTKNRHFDPCGARVKIKNRLKVDFWRFLVGGIKSKWKKCFVSDWNLEKSPALSYRLEPLFFRTVCRL